MQSVNRLPTETTAQLRSTIILTSLPQIVSELVQNSLDAGALHLSVGVDPTEWSCWVQDDGYGIPVENLQTIGMNSDAGRYGWCFYYWNIPGDVHRTSHTAGFRIIFLSKFWRAFLIDFNIISGTSKIPDAISNHTASKLGFRGEGDASSILCKLFLANPANISSGFRR